MKKLRLRPWVKVTLGVIVGVLILVAFKNFNEKEIDNCVNAGHTVEYCKRGL